MRKKSFTIFTESIAQVSAMSDADAGALFKAVLRYSLDGTEPQSGTLVHFAFLQFKQQIDEDDNRRKEISEKRKESANSRWGMQLHANGCNCMQMDAIASPDTSPVPQQPKQKKPKADPEAIKQRQEAKKEDFYQSLVPFVKVYGKEMVREFFDYWTEPNKSGSKWRFELEKTWDLSRRLNTWASRNRVPSSSCNGNNRTSNQEAAKKRQEDAASIIARLAAEDDARS